MSFGTPLRDLALSKNTTAAKLAEVIARQRNIVDLSSAIRIFVYNHFRSLGEKQAVERGHDPARRHLDSKTLRTRAEECRALARGLDDGNRVPQCSGLPPTMSEWPQMRRD